MNKKEFKELVFQIYPSDSALASYKLCADDTGFSHETIRKMCEQKFVHYPIRKGVVKLLIMIKEKKDIITLQNAYKNKYLILGQQKQEFEEEKKKLEIQKQEQIKANQKIYKKFEEKKKDISESLSFIIEKIENLKKVLD